MHDFGRTLERISKKDIIEIESSKLAKKLESTSLRIAVLACQKYLVRQGYQVIRCT